MANESDSKTAASVVRVLKPFYDAWMALVHAFSWVLTRIVAVLMFVVGFIPYGLAIRLLRRDPLRLKFDRDGDSYWIETPSENRSLDDFRKQY